MQPNTQSKTRRDEQIASTIQSLIERFETGKISELLTLTMTPRHPKDRRPSDKWSYSNRLIMLIQGTSDARGMKQWNEAGRRIVKGSRSIFIWGPLFKKVAEKNDEGETEHSTHLVGFRTIPVFRYEDTEGEPLPVFNYEPPAPPPLMDVAQKFGVKVTYEGNDPNADYAGYYSQNRKEIHLLTHDNRAFWHELSHAAHGKILESKGLKLRDRHPAEKEAVAEIGACVIASFYGEDLSGTSYRYLLDACGENPLKTLLRVVDEIGETVALILSSSQET